MSSTESIPELLRVFREVLEFSHSMEIDEEVFMAESGGPEEARKMLSALESTSKKIGECNNLVETWKEEKEKLEKLVNESEFFKFRGIRK